jgi:hypothetical protein
MPTMQSVGAAQLEYLQFPLGLPAEQRLVELHQPVHHRVLGVVFFPAYVCQEQRSATFGHQMGLKLVDEFLELASGSSRFLDLAETVQNDECRTVRSNLLSQ